MDERPYGCSRRAGLGCLLILALLFGCVGSVMLVVDAGCHNSMTQKLPIYPGAQVVSMKYNFFRPFGMGETLALLTTDDTPDAVRNWYGKTVGAAYRAVQQGNNDPFFFLANARYTVTAGESGTGSQILLSGVCAAG